MSLLRTIAIGDIHGCKSLLDSLLDHMNYDPTSDHLVFVGDYLDRGPYPASVVRLIRTLDACGHVTAIKGNHEQKCIDWYDREHLFRTTGRPNGMSPPSPKRREQWDELSVEDIDWLRKLSLTARPLPGWIAVHAGFEDKPLKDQRPDKMTRVCFINPLTGEVQNRDENADLGSQPQGSIRWMERWRGPENIVYGHLVHSRKTPRIDRPAPGVETWGIDTGACYGGRLTALDLETRQVFQVGDGVSYAKLYGKRPDGS